MIFVMRLAICAILSLIFFSCAEKKPAPLFELVKNSGIDFINKVADNDTINILNYRNFYNGGGVACGDINNDGLADIFFTANQGSNKLFLNQGNFKFTDISAKAGFVNKLQFSTGVVMADINADGWLDIFVCNAGSMQQAALRTNQLFINNHDLTFTESAAKYGLADSGYTTQVSFFDYDLDGDLDCFKIDNSPVPVNSLGYPKQRNLPASQWKVDEYLRGGGDHLYQNDDGFFKEVTASAGIHGTLMSFGLGVTVGDVNGDNYPDIYVSNDFFERDYLYINQKNGTFTDELEQRLQHNSYASMGADFGDINNDGFPEIFTTDMLPADDYRLKTTLSFDDIDQYRLKERNGFYNQFLQNTLQLNDGRGKFKDIANYSGVNASEWSWGALMFDADNDGYNDLYVCNGIYRDLTNQDFLAFDANEIRERMIQTGEKKLNDLVNRIPSIAVPNKMYRNLGNLKFADQGVAWGFSENSFSNGAAYADFDNDGDLDLVVNNTNEPAFIFKNASRQLNKNNFIGIQLKGNKPNSFAVGAKIIAYKGQQIFSRELIPSRGFQSSVDYRQLIGVGSANSIDSLVIIWPDWQQTTMLQPQLNKYHVIQQPTGTPKLTIVPLPVSNAIFEQQPATFDKHTDDDYTDFYTERGMPEMLSHEGPKAAVADVNGDQLDDIYIGGSVSTAGQLYLQTADGGFKKSKQHSFDEFKDFVDGPSLFFDADGDADMDLLVCAAGNDALPGSRQLQHRLFLNDGKANFTITKTAFPSNKDNTSVAIADDFDGDGDADLFIGAGSVTGQYGITPQSHIYLNNGKAVFADMPASKCPGITDAGMVTGAAFTDMDGDKKNELVIVGRWMAPLIFKYTAQGFTPVTTNLSVLKGWWQTVKAVDINKDGLPDLVLGNMGENLFVNPTTENPAKLFLNDFDDNGQLDKIFTRSINGKDKPVFMKAELEAQMPFLKKQNLRHNAYAQKSVQELMSAEKINSAIVKSVNTSSSCIAINKGNGQFEVTNFPPAVQFSSVKCVTALDANGDGLTDLILGGNEFGFQPQLGRLDANTGLVLLNKGKQGWQVLSEYESGITGNAQMRDMVMMQNGLSMCLVLLYNNEVPAVYKFKKTASTKK
ncbi:MAG: hypothetical protein RL172_773 [Bacteroidota bacterium]